MFIHRLYIQATDMSIRIREMVYHKVKVNKILSKVSGTPYEKVNHLTNLLRLSYFFLLYDIINLVSTFCSG